MQRIIESFQTKELELGVSFILHNLSKKKHFQQWLNNTFKPSGRGRSETETAVESLFSSVEFGAEGWGVYRPLEKKKRDKQNLKKNNIFLTSNEFEDDANADSEPFLRSVTVLLCPPFNSFSPLWLSVYQ